MYTMKIEKLNWTVSSHVQAVQHQSHNTQQLSPDLCRAHECFKVSCSIMMCSVVSC